jgi:hypothetical protein
MRSLAGGVLLLLLAGCVGSRQEIRFATAKVPLSLSPQLLDIRGQSVGSEQLEIVGQLAARQRGWSIFWTLLPLRGIDFSDVINQQVTSAGGEAVVNLKLTSQEGCTLSLNQIPFAALLPIFPGCTDVSISGEIVRYRKDAPRKGTLRLLR